MVSIRMVRLGRRNRPFFRIRAADSRNAAGGRFIEELGTVDPIEKNPEKQVVLKRDRIEHWLRFGAQPSDTVRSLLEKHRIGAPATPK